jgi:thiol-disulfide isomerase/thioredoxin
MIKSLIKVTILLTAFQPGYGQTLISGFIKGLNNDTLFISSNYHDINNTHKDTVLSNSGSFNFQLDIIKPTVIVLEAKSAFEPLPMTKGVYLPQTKRILFLVTENDRIKLTAELNDDAITYEIESSLPINKEIQILLNSSRKKGIQKLNIERKMSDSFLRNDNQEYDRLNKEYLSLREDSRTESEEYIKSNLDKDMSAFYTIFKCSPSQFIANYDLLSDNVKNGLFRDMLIDRLLIARTFLGLNKSGKIEPGFNAPEFILQDLNGKDVKLSDFKNKYIVLDFWGTWCLPCLKGLPKMMTYYKKYNANLEILSIACNDDKIRVTKLVQKEGLPWIQLMNKLPQDVVSQYEISKYPTKILIDRNGSIIEIFTGESDDFYDKIDKLLDK